MFHSVNEFISLWEQESNSTQKIMDALTDQSLNQQVTPEGRTLGRIAWHVVTSLDEMIARTGLQFEAVKHDAPVPATAQEIADGYRTSSQNILQAVKEHWTDETLNEVDDMYGEKWPKGLTLSILNYHQIHHRGQMTVLMRQAGLKVPGVYGPSQEEWSQMGMEAPEI
ncbi:DinB family protein [Neobacillus sp. LXY-4]|uniref:DinB family protein n=1 Tax=Neobacillus sp. LXY-4 TaxID=3379826 RepID=UPI003EE10664